jgi:hypothetical protein
MKNIKSNPSKTVLTIAAGFILVYLVTKLKWAISVAFIIALAGIFSDYLSKKIDFLWMKLVWLLSLIVPNIILGLIFFLFLFPVSFLSKIFGRKDPLHLKNNGESLYINSNKEFSRTSFEKPW